MTLSRAPWGLPVLLWASTVAAQPLLEQTIPPAVRAGQFEQAVMELDARLAAASAAERPALLYWRGRAHGLLGARSLALADLDASLKETAATGASAADRAAVARALGAELMRAGAGAQARLQFERALLLAAGVPAIQASVLHDLAELEAKEERPEEAAAAYRESLKQAETAQLPDRIAPAAIGLLRLQPAAPQAPDLARLAGQAVTAMPDSHDKAYHLVALAALDSGRSDQWLALAATTAEAIGDRRALSHAYGERGALHLAAGHTELALALTGRAVLAAQQANAPEALYRWQWQSARLLARLGRVEPSLAAYRRAQATLAGIRQDLMGELRASRRSYRDTVGPLYLEYADLLLQRAGREAPNAQRLLLEARDAIETLKAVELEDYFQDECVALLQARQKELDRLAPRTAVLYPVILPDRVEMLVSLASGMRQVTLAVQGEQLSAEARTMRQLLEKRTTHQYLPYARRLYDWLLRPLEPLLEEESVDTLILVPDGPLRTFPLAALHDGERFLVERMVVATAPALRLIEPRALSAQSTRVLLSGLSLGVQQFPPLPYVASEVSAIRKMLPATVLADEQFVLGSFERELRDVPYSVVHIASHAQFDGDPKKSFLLTYDGRFDMDTLERVMKLSRFREEPVELLTLSACRTAAGDERAALGLAGVAVKAGARSALATLWYINDQASSALVSEFYRRLSERPLSKARALQQAQRSLLADPRYRHPGFWSPFLLIGNWL